MKAKRLQWFCVAVLLVAGWGWASMAAPLFTENGGVVDIEVEGWSNNIPRLVGGQSFEWESDSTAGYSGAGALEAVPNIGTNLNATWISTSPELQYAVNFSHAQTHYVWIRGYGAGQNDDSIHAGLDFSTPGATNTAAHMTWQDRWNSWVWTNRNNVGNLATISVGSTGYHTFRLWMREDGMRVDRVILTTNTNFQPVLGNCWHIPDGIEAGAGGLTMRSPLGGMATNENIFLYTGNQFQGGGNAGNQLQTGSTIYYKHAASNTWNSIPMFFWYEGGANGNNKYYSNSIPANVFSSGDIVQYYFRIPYSDHLATFIGGNNAKFEIEADAQANPFMIAYQWPSQPTGSGALITQNFGSSDQVHARIYSGTGHVEIRREGFGGFELAETDTFLPSWALVNGNSFILGPATVVSNTTDSLVVRQSFGFTNVVAKLSFPYDHVFRYEVLDWGGATPKSTYIAALSPTSEHFYGLGEKFNSFDQAGKRTRIITDDPPGNKGDKSYKVMPWFISTRGYGFHLDSSAESYFDLRAAASDRYFIDHLFGTLKFNVVVGPKLTDVLSRFSGYTGRPQMSPPWAFAPWMSSDRWATGGEVRYVLTKYRERGIPGSVFVFDSPWEVGYNDFTWNIGAGNQFSNGGTFEGQFYPGFATVTDMMTFLRTNGWKSINWMTPFINTNSQCCGEVPGQNLGPAANYAEGAASNYFVRASLGGPPFVTNWWKGTGSPVDYTNPDARKWISNQLSNLVNVSKSGGFEVIGGFKTDDGESGNPPGSYIPKSVVYFDGRTGEEMQNGYATEYHRTIWNVLGTNGILFARSGFTGSQAYPGYWAGDNKPNYGQDNGLQSVVVAGQSAAMCGYSTWSHDIGGYQNDEFSSTLTNLFMRWTQFGAFSPLMQMHRQTGSPVASYFPWGYGPDALTNYQFYAKLHTALFPYIYSYATEASTNGLPIIRPLVLLNQDDPNVYAINHTYFFGNELLVAPVVTNTTSFRTVYLPAGKWHDFFTSTTYTGGQTIIWTNADQSLMPLFVRNGGIVPMISTNVQTLVDAAYAANPNLVTMDSSLEFLVYPATSSSFTVYDGTSLQCQSNGTVVALSLASTARSVSFRIRAAAPSGVERDGVRMPSFTNATDFAAATFGWRHDVTTGFLHVKISHTGGATQIRFGPDTVGDGISDSWRGYHFPSPTPDSCATCDPDGDGLTNEQEYLAGTSPIDPANRLRIDSIASAGRDVGVQFRTVPGMKYRVEYRDDLVAGSWVTLPGYGTVTGSGSVISASDPGAAVLTKRFYRVTVLP